MRDFRDKVVVITGAGSGIGKATAHAFARQGARLHLVDIRLDRVEGTAEEIRMRGNEATSHTLDCGDSVAMRELADHVFEREGRVHVLQSGAGVMVSAPVERITLEQWRSIIDTNLWGVVNGLHAFLPRMLEQGEPSHLVHVASVAGLVGFPYTSAYTATKFALVGLTEVLVAELAGRGVGVTAVCPGMVRTNLMGDGVLDLPGVWGRVVKQSYELFAARPESIARAILAAIRRGRTLVVPSLALAQLWLLKRLAPPELYAAATRRMMALIRAVGR